MVRDPGSEIQKKPISDPGYRIQGLKRHRIPDPQHCILCTGNSCRSGMDPGATDLETGKQTLAHFFLFSVIKNRVLVQIHQKDFIYVCALLT